MTGRMMSLYTLGTMGTTPLGALIGGAVIDRASPRTAIGLGAASAVVTGLVLIGAAVLSRRDASARGSGRGCSNLGPGAVSAQHVHAA
jgi:zinc transporter ZupT